MSSTVKSSRMREIQHNKGVNNQMSNPILSDLLSRLFSNGGFSYSPTTKSFLAEGYAVSIYKDRETVTDLGQSYNAATAAIASFWINNIDTLHEPNHVFGAWINPEDGKLYLDVSIVTLDLVRARDLARAHSQLAIFDITKGETIYV